MIDGTPVVVLVFAAIVGAVLIYLVTSATKAAQDSEAGSRAVGGCGCLIGLVIAYAVIGAIVRVNMMSTSSKLVGGWRSNCGTVTFESDGSVIFEEVGYSRGDPSSVRIKGKWSFDEEQRRIWFTELVKRDAAGKEVLAPSFSWEVSYDTAGAFASQDKFGMNYPRGLMTMDSSGRNLHFRLRE